MTDNIALSLSRVAEIHGPKTAIVEAATGKELSFIEVDLLSDSYARYFLTQGVKPGDRVMLMVKPSADFICLTFALFKIGAPVILIDPGMGYRNLLKCISGVKPRIFIGIPRAHIFKKLNAKQFKTVEKSFCHGFSYGLFGKDLRRCTCESQSKLSIYQPNEDDLAAIIFTTGSTGPPKGVRYEHSIFAAQLRLIRDYYKISSSDTDQPAFPLFALFSTALGASAVIPDMDSTKPAKVDPEKFIFSLQKNRVTYSFGSPALWNVVSRHCLENNITLNTLNLVLMAGAPIPGDLLERMVAILPSDASIHTPYGATECLPIVSMEAKEILDETWMLTKKGKGTCVGRALPDISIKVIAITEDEIIDIDTIEELQQGEIGEIIVQGDVVTRAYDNNRTETKKSKIYDGKSIWHRMGDIGYLDESGRLWFCGRKGHRVITSKGVLFTIPCEAIVNNHPWVFRSALVGIDDPESIHHKLPVIIIEAKKNIKIDNENLLKEIRMLTTSNTLTSHIQWFLLHPDFPVDIRHNAKIFREKLSVWAQEELQGKV